MAREEAFPLSERKENVHQKEESVGLLDNEDRDDGNHTEDEELVDWHLSRTSAPRKSRRRYWFGILVIAVPVAWLVGFVVHTFLIPRQSEVQNNGAAKLRTEQDYILDPEWKFDAGPTTREYHWTVAEHELNPDGVYRPMTLIDATFPGPLIECNEGDEIVVHVHNEATNATSIHWHGLFQNGTNYMDGTVGITQCPIAPGHSFTYRFNVSGQSGTYWYHSHMSMQASDGLVGPIVIHARGDERKTLQKVPYVEDRVVLVSDHYYDLSSSLVMQYLQPGNENDEPVPQAAVINGRGTRNCSDLPNRKCSSSGISNALFDLSPDHNTRLRFINVGAFAEFQIQLDEHEVQLTEVDGVDVHPQSIHRLNINPAQRYSIIVTPPADNKGLYWMRARMITHCFAYEEPELQEEVRAIIRYGNPTSHSPTTPEEPQSKDWPEVIEVECKDLNTSTLSPVLAIPAPSQADDLIYLRSSFQIHDWRLSRGYLNDSSYRANLSHPTLTTFITGVQQKSPPHLYSLSTPYGLNTYLYNASTTLVYQTTGIRTLDILLQNFDDGNHPFHLHGHTFFVLASGHGYPPAPDTLRENLDLTNPLRRDTASLEAYGWVLVRFVADNPGAWAFHCHIGWHNEAGLAMVFLTGAEVLARLEVPKEVEGLCGVEGMEKGAPPPDEVWVGSWD
ncbi:multicopper oxidase [Periconia macrospinosa]|uniref:Multicopper oxidase n=1 Tax=Periconia macrospinosa TaxID=97972 RepID=A0A2V1D4G8_9PLEO|nr:multicopper oxidase [Periconia macrospinosa]